MEPQFVQDMAAHARRAPAPAVLRLDLTDFRNYQRQRLEVGARPVVLVGPNGAGKTNLLEALSYLAPGRGLRRARLGEAARQGGPGAWAVAAEVLNAFGRVELGAAFQTDDEGERRLVRVDGRTGASAAAFAEHLPLTWLTPQMDGLFREGASARRRFLDRLVYGLDPGHARRVAAYEKAMRDRNRLLALGGEARWLAAQEETMAGHAVAVAAARRDAVARLGVALAQADGPFPRAGLAVAGRLEDDLATDTAVAVEDRYRDLLAASRAADAAAGGATEGPHRSDMLVRHAAKDQPAELCSTGEQKALLVALVLAEARIAAARRGAPPVLLLDEVAAHFDRARREALYDQVLRLGAQAWLTGTDAETFAPLQGRADFFAVRDGFVAAGGV